MPPAEADENPYASPVFVEPQRGPDTLRRATVQIYRVLGWAGLAYICLILLTAMLFMLGEGRARLGLVLGMTFECVLMMAFFAFMIRTAARLEADLGGTYWDRDGNRLRFRHRSRQQSDR